MSQYLRYTLNERASGQLKTEVWNVEATRDGTLLGRVKWFGRWRQYAFFPESGTVFNPDCLDSINGWIRGLMQKRREAANSHARPE